MWFRCARRSCELWKGNSVTREIILATGNAHKVQEISAILGAVLPGVSVAGYADAQPAETGVTFCENALIKARAAALVTGKMSIADDSGIAVDVLGGAPGIFSARWAGKNSSDKNNLELLLQQLQDIVPKSRGAEFVCAAAVVQPLADGQLFERCVVGRWRGVLLDAPRGGAGFGYDPIFCPEGYSVSAAELDGRLKNQLSHRRKAFNLLVAELQQLLA
nr:RdgB/HAM1 family non-canonical purine NTP pyrophosphatase [Canibacter zhuwentaonis]